MNEFGNLLRYFRNRCRDPLSVTQRLSQQKLGEKLGKKLGIQGYSGAAISDWERGKSKIHADDRLLLITLFKVLHEHGGLQTIIEANQILEVGNYRALDDEEIQKVFTQHPVPSDAKQIEQQENSIRQNPSLTSSLIQMVFSISEEEFRELIEKAEDGPLPSWPRVLAALLRKTTDSFSISIKTILWIAVWGIAVWLIGPSLRWPFANRESAFLAIGMYVCASLIIPLLIGALVNTKDNEYWKQQSTASPFLIRLYTYQGAGIGFNLGYFFGLPICLARHYLNLESTVWMEVVAATLSLILGNMAARVVPHNLWLAYKRLTLGDGWIFFIVAFVGPMWGFFFLEYYSILLSPLLGTTVILLAVIGTITLSRRQAKKREKELSNFSRD